MSEERKRMSIAEVEAVLVDLPDEQLHELLGRVMDQRVIPEEEIDPAVLAEARRRVDDMRSGRVAPVPFEQLLDDLEEPTLQELEAEAMQLSEADRAELVDRLIDGLTGTNAYNPALIAEIESRMGEIEAGTAKTVPAEEVFAKMRARRNARSLS